MAAVGPDFYVYRYFTETELNFVTSYKNPLSTTRSSRLARAATPPSEGPVHDGAKDS